MKKAANENDIAKAVGGFCRLYDLTAREEEILSLLVGKVVTAENIGEFLGISRNTVRIHFQNIFNKIGTSSKSEILGKFIEFLMEGSHLDVPKDIAKKLTILMADDDPAYINLVVRALEKLIGDRVVFKEVGDGLQLLNYMNNCESDAERYPRPDLILLDISMPEIDGFEALVKLKSNDNTKQVPIIVFSSTQEAADVKKIYSLGGNSFVPKPPSFRSLVKVMSSILVYWGQVGALPAYTSSDEAVNKVGS